MRDQDPIDWTMILAILIVVALAGLWLGRALAGGGM